MGSRDKRKESKGKPKKEKVPAIQDFKALILMKNLRLIIIFN